MTATMQMGHVGLNVSDLDRSKKFYQDLLGFEVKAESEEHGRKFILLGRGPAILLTLWEQAKGRYAPGLAGLHHLSFMVDDMEDVRRAETRLKGQGVEFHHSGIVAHATGAPSGGIYFRDPDGIRLEIFAPTGAAAMPAPESGASCGFF